LAVPQHVAGRRLHQQGALADGEAGDGADAGEAGLLLTQFVLIALRRHLLERGPLLAAPADVLALVLTDRATRRWRLAGGELDAAGHTDVRRHHRLRLKVGHGAGLRSPAAFVVSPRRFRI